MSPKQCSRVDLNFEPSLTLKGCKELLHKVQKRLAGWKTKLLSYAGGICLIKHVLVSPVRYWVAMFQLSAPVLNRIVALTSGFLWGNVNEVRVFQFEGSQIDPGNEESGVIVGALGGGRGEGKGHGTEAVKGGEGTRAEGADRNRLVTMMTHVGGVRNRISNP
ncbi:putative ribonuclease H protein [Nymphaea thermarum]|nr:putative ribonuclease H protein [Nymphaea thermarum]